MLAISRAAALDGIRRLVSTPTGLTWLLVALFAAVRLSDFVRLPLGNADDMTTDFVVMNKGLWHYTYESARSHGRIYYFLSLPVYGFLTSIGGSLLYDVINLGTFALGSVLPVLALRRRLGDAPLQLYTLAYFTTLPFLYSYTPPYAYPGYMFLPLLFCGLALLLRNCCPIVAGVCYVLSLCGYEPVLLTSLGLYAIYWLAQPSPRPSVRAPALLTAAYVVLYLGFRHFTPHDYEGAALSLPASIPAALQVIVQLSSTSSIFGWYHSNVWLTYIDHATGFYHATPLSARSPIWPPSALPGGIPLLLLAAPLAAWVLYAAPRPRLPKVLFPAAAALIFLPNVIYPLTAKIAKLVLDGTIPAYTATRFSQIGLCLLLSLLLFLLPRIAAAPLAAALLAWGALAVVPYNHSATLYARMQASKWEALRALNACSAQLPAAYLSTVHAPRLWNFSTSPTSWIPGEQENNFYDLWSRRRLGLQAHFVREKPAGPRTLFDYHLAPDGSLSGAVIARAPSGEDFTEVYLIKPAAAIFPGRVGDQGELQQTRSSCSSGYRLARFAGQSFDLNSLSVTALPPWAGR